MCHITADTRYSSKSHTGTAVLFIGYRVIVAESAVYVTPVDLRFCGLSSRDTSNTIHCVMCLLVGSAQTASLNICEKGRISADN